MKHLLFFVAIVLLTTTSFVSAEAALEISADDRIVGEPATVVNIDTLQLTGTPDGDVPVKLVVTSGTLEMTTTTGITFTGPATGSTLEFTGSLANVNTALATLTYFRGTTGADELEVSLVEPGQVFFEETGNLYEYITFTGNWNAAETNAQTLTRYGATGYLTTILTAQENQFVAARLEGAGWMGASDSAGEGDWKWVTGPETGTSFWTGNGNGSTVNGNYANWGTGEPNDSGGDEDCAQFLSSNGLWNDLNCAGSSLPGYVAEFGAPGNQPDVVANTIDILIDTPVTIETVTPADDSLNSALDTDLVIEFDKNITIGTGNITLRNVADNSVLSIIDITSNVVTGDMTDTLTIDLGTLLETTEYLVEFEETTLQGVNGLRVIDLGTFETNFTTLTTPQVVSTDPQELEKGVSQNYDITLIFSEAMNTTVDPDISITPCTFGNNKDQCAVVSGTWINDTSYVIDNPAGEYQYGTKYTVTVDNGEDQNESVGLLVPFTLTFTAEEKRSARSSSSDRAAAIFAKHFEDKDINDVENPTEPKEETSTSAVCLSEQILTQNMTLGDRDGQLGRSIVITQVATLQNYLNDIFGYLEKEERIAVDGIYGPMTRQAVQVAQELLETNQGANLGRYRYDGVVGPLTRAAITGHCTNKKNS